jgi:hypothetical protein
MLPKSKITPMPWPVTHILVAESLYNPYFNHLDHQQFILGNAFPDIRYPAKIDRHLTHFEVTPLEEMQSQSAFRAGVLFHSVVDHFWNAILLKDNETLFASVPHNSVMIHTMKVLQDGFLYENGNHWNKISGYFDDIFQEELAYGADEPMVNRWHLVLGNYLRKPPQFTDLEMLKASLPSRVVEQIRTTYQEFSTHPILKSQLIHFYQQARDLLPDFLSN